MSLSVLTAFPSTGRPRGLVYSAGSSQPSARFWDPQFACLRLPCKRPRIKHTFSWGWLGCCRSAEPFGQWSIMLIPKAFPCGFRSGSALALNLGLSDALGNLNTLRRLSWGAYCLRSLWASRTCLLAFPSKGKPAPPGKASQSYPGAEKVIKRFCFKEQLSKESQQRKLRWWQSEDQRKLARGYLEKTKPKNCR